MPLQFRPQLENEYCKLSNEEQQVLELVMHRLADRVRIRRIQIFPLFEDYDRVHNGTVSRFQFHRVLSELDLGSLVSAQEFMVMKKKFDVVLGYKHDFNYIGFCDMVNDFANFEYGKPWTLHWAGFVSAKLLFFVEREEELCIFVQRFQSVNILYFIQRMII